MWIIDGASALILAVATVATAPTAAVRDIAYEARAFAEAAAFTAAPAAEQRRDDVLAFRPVTPPFATPRARDELSWGAGAPTFPPAPAAAPRAPDA